MLIVKHYPLPIEGTQAKNTRIQTHFHHALKYSDLNIYFLSYFIMLFYVLFCALQSIGTELKSP